MSNQLLMEFPERQLGVAMNVLVLGSGGREHAIVHALVKSRDAEQIFVAPGNGGTALIAENVELNPLDDHAVMEFCYHKNVNLVVIGPEAPLVEGVADYLRFCGLDVFGPGAKGAELEGSKKFSKDFMLRNNLPTAEYAAFTDLDEALAYLDEHPAPIVIKADGLAAGKGVTVAESTEEAKAAVRDCFSGKFGEAGSSVVIEECLDGPECSMLAFVSAVTAPNIELMAASQDHKRALEGDKGPNTGGMGVYSPVPIVTDEESAAMADIMQKAAEALYAESIEYQGILYGGFMLTANGPKLLEFNARFGDPETQVLLPRLKNDFLEVILAVAQNRLDEIELEWDGRWAVSVVLASKGYPESYKCGFEITGIKDAEQLAGVTVYHAGTKSLENGAIVTSGGRVLNVTALADSFEEARDLAYKACDLIEFEGKQYRRDIGERALKGRNAWK
jgi:phosphoribosylamine--glycine ligase